MLLKCTCSKAGGAPVQPMTEQPQGPMDMRGGMKLPFARFS